jgi:hypothetical protein
MKSSTFTNDSKLNNSKDFDMSIKCRKLGINFEEPINTETNYEATLRRQRNSARVKCAEKNIML